MISLIRIWFVKLGMSLFAKKPIKDVQTSSDFAKNLQIHI